MIPLTFAPSTLNVFPLISLKPISNAPLILSVASTVKLSSVIALANECSIPLFVPLSALIILAARLYPLSPEITAPPSTVGFQLSAKLSSSYKSNVSEKYRFSLPATFNIMSSRPDAPNFVPLILLISIEYFSLGIRSGILIKKPLVSDSFIAKSTALPSDVITEISFSPGVSI